MTQHRSRLLVIDDEVQIRRLLRVTLEAAEFEVHEAETGGLGLSEAASLRPEGIILDLGLPDMDGKEVLRRLREWSRVPVLVLSVRDGEEETIAALDLGADDYLTKPFAFAELSARLQALIRRATRAPEATRLTAGDVELDLVSRVVTVAGRPVELQPREFALLEYLLRHPRRPVTKTMILEHIWDYAFDPKTNVVDVLVCRLRNKIDRDFSPKLIHTMRGFGYVLKADEA